jgi:hypothetical protein
MFQAAIVGEQGSGKTTLLGLLYATLVRSGSEKEDGLRFHAAYESLDEITGLFQRLMSGGFPDSAYKEGIRELKLQLGLPRSRRGILSRFGSAKWADGASSTVRFTLPGDLEQAARGLFGGSTFGTGPWRDALDADALLLVVDSTRLAAKGQDPESRPMAAYDGQIVALLTAIRRWRSHGGRDVLHPIFVFSKFDAVSPKVLRAAGLDAEPPEVSRPGPRAAYANALLEANLPRALAALQEPSKGKPRFARGTSFFSSVGTETGAAGSDTRLRLRSIASGGWEPDYSRGEYVALWEHLAGAAADTRD